MEASVRKTAPETTHSVNVQLSMKESYVKDLLTTVPLCHVRMLESVIPIMLMMGIHANVFKVNTICCWLNKDRFGL